MTRRFRLQLERVNLLAVLALTATTTMCLTGKISADVALAAILGIAVPGHSSAAPPGD